MPSQQNTDAWWSWATGVLNRIGAPSSPENYKSLWNWSIKESGQDPIANGNIHNNPLNTTQSVPGSTSQNSVGVQSFPDLSTSVNATTLTLLNGRYPHILDALRNSKPTGSWLGWESAIGPELKTWGSGTNWLGWNSQPPQPSNKFVAGQLSGGSSVTGSGSGNPVGDAINSALGTALGPIGDAITSAEQSFVQTATNYFLMAVGVLFMLGGLALIAVMTVKVSTPVRQVAETAASVTPAGRAVAVAKTVKPAPAAAKPLSPAAQSAIAAAKAGRGSKLSPDVKEELRGRTA
jgi:hypothetical protein